jgi:WS/DGAT/MGAT family acyltransferase
MHVIEESRRQHMHTIKIAILGPRDGVAVPAEDVREWARERLPRIPALRWLVHDVPMGLGRPYFTDPGVLDVDQLSTVVRLESPGSDVQLDEVVSGVASRQLPRDRPLWDLTIVEGMSGDRVGLIFKIHHAIMDGQACVRFMEIAFDGSVEMPFGPPPGSGEGTPTGSELIAAALKSQAQLYGHLPKVARRTFASVKVNRALKASGAPPVAAPLSGPSARFNKWPRPDRIYVDVTIPFAEMKALKDAAGVTINELWVAVCGGAIRRYLVANNELPERGMNCAHPISLRQPEQIDTFGNHTSYWYVALGTEIADPLQRLAAVKQSLDAAKAWAHGDQELFAVWQDYYLLFGKLTLKGLTLAEKTSRRPAFNAVVSNVRGPGPLSLGGAPVVAVRSMGPITRTLGLNMTAWSYGDNFSIGLQSCHDFMPDLRTMDGHIRDELEAFQKALANKG